MTPVNRAGKVALAAPPRQAGTSAHRWLCSALRAAILDGRLPPGAQLPATRELARQYRLARGTVVTAFDQMKAEGYIVARSGSGTFVNDVLPDSLLEIARAPGVRRPLPLPQPRRMSDAARRLRAFPFLSASRARAFRANQPALDLFPMTLWAQVAGRRLRRASVDLLRGCDALGYLPLRQAVSDYLRSSRGVVCTPAQVAIVSGVQEALDLVARLFVNPGDRVCVESPGYIGATRVFETHGASVSGLGLDEEGMMLPAGNKPGVRLIYVTPAHQFPIGVSMSLPRRLALVEWARRHRALIFEDDYDSEYRYTGPPVPALQGLDRSGIVLYAGSFSKVLFPSIRLGYLVVPQDVVDALSAMKSVTSRFAPLLEQAVLSDFIAEGHFGRHVRRMRGIYAERLSVLIESARRTLGGLLEVSDVEAGLQTAAWLGKGLTGASVAVAASQRDVETIPLSRYALRPLRREGLVLGFAAVDAAEIRRGVRELGAALEATRRG